MTMPHLMNCPHSADGWCLECVVALGNRELELRAEVRRLRDALMPFAHDDLCEVTGGMVQGSDSPVYGKNKATLRLADFERARAALLPMPPNA